MKHGLIIPSLLLFLGGVATGFSVFPYIYPTNHVPQPHSVIPPASSEVRIEHSQPLSSNTHSAQNPQNPSPEGVVLQLFAPTSAELSEMQDDSALQELLEQTLMISFLLSNCDLMSKNEYSDTYKALVEYLSANGTPDPRQTAFDAAERAKASYKMLYKNVPCDDPSLVGLRDSLASWRTSISTDNKP